MLGHEELRKRFTTHTLDDADVAYVAHLRSIVFEVAMYVDQVAPDGREKSTAITKLEEALMWAVKGIARSSGK